MKNFKSLVALLEAFPNEKACVAHLEAIRWRDGAFCPHCGCRKVYHFKDGINHKCAECRKRFSVKVGTIFEDSKISLQKWFMAIYLITAHKKGIASTQLARDLGVTQKTAWFMLHRLRYASQTKSFNAPLKNTVEADETFVGGKERNKHKSKRTPGTQGRNTLTKSAVLALIERDGEVRVFHLNDVTSRTLQTFIGKHVALGARVMTDEYRAYTGLSTFYDHQKVNHSIGKYVVSDAHTNTAEGFFSLFKRGVVGIYHYVSPKHLHRYLSEFSFRYNLRQADSDAQFFHLMQNCGGRLTYKALIADPNGADNEPITVPAI
jgi:transposase-like protein